MSTCTETERSNTDKELHEKLLMVVAAEVCKVSQNTAPPAMIAAVVCRAVVEFLEDTRYDCSHPGLIRELISQLNVAADQFT